MGSYKTADEVKKEHVEKMGDDLGSLFHELWNEVVWLYSKWDEYVELFGTKPSRIELLNRSAPLFFRTVEDSLWADTLLHIARLTDPPKSAGKSNLTIQRLPGLVDKQVQTNVSNLTKNAIDNTAFCRDWRNRRIAHRDLKLAMSEGAKPLEPASREMVKTALKAIAAVLNAMSEYYLDSTIEFGVIKGSFGAVSLLYVLDDGLQAESQRRKRIESGEYRQDDLEVRDL